MRVPAVEVVVVHRDHAEMLRPGFLVEAHQPIRNPLFGMLEGKDFLPSVGEWMAETFGVILIVWRYLFILPARLPIPVLRR